MDIWHFFEKKSCSRACSMLLTAVNYSTFEVESYHLTLPLYVTSQINHMKYDSTSCGSNKEQGNDDK